MSSPERHLHVVQSVSEDMVTPPQEGMPGIINTIPGYQPTVPDIAAAPDLITEAPFEIAEPEPPVTAPRYLIKKVPSQSELEAGSSYEGEEQEFKDVAKLLKILEQFDPDKKLANPDYRNELIQHASVQEVKDAIVAINTALYETETDSNLADREVLLINGTGDERKVGLIGINPEDADEVLAAMLDGMKLFSAEGKMVEAGLLAANTLIPLQMLKDGNKRTARAVFELMGYGYDGSHYDQSAMRRRLGYTQEARQSFFASARDSRLVTAFQQSRIPQEIRAGFDRFDTYWDEARQRQNIVSYAIGVRDPVLRESVVDILQQTGFGARYIYESSRPELIEQFDAAMNADERKVARDGMLQEFADKLSDDSARELVAYDRQERKNYLKRLISSSTGEDKMPLYYDKNGNPNGSQFASIAA